MTFAEALKTGSKIKRADWEETFWLVTSPSVQCINGVVKGLTAEDAEASDWMVEEPSVKVTAPLFNEKFKKVIAGVPEVKDPDSVMAALLKELGL